MCLYVTFWHRAHCPSAAPTTWGIGQSVNSYNDVVARVVSNAVTRNLIKVEASWTMWFIPSWNILITVGFPTPKTLLADLYELWIIIQTHIRNTDSYSDTDSGNFPIRLSNQWFSLNIIKVSQRVANDQIIDGETSLQKSVVLPIIRGISPT